MSVSLDHVLGVAAFCLAGSMSPGPNNFMLLASGVNFGFARTLPHLIGVVAGYLFLLLVIGFGLGNLFAAYPAAHTALKVVGGLYLLWLAWKIATASTGGGKAEAARPFTFLQAAAFQWVNPKGVLLGVSAVAAFTRPQAFAATFAVLVAVSTAANLLSATTWALFGSALSRWLAQPHILRPFNIGMALLLAASLWPMLAG
jgi:threonine/homoserine/homoserine lactone efflux protein